MGQVHRAVILFVGTGAALSLYILASFHENCTAQGNFPLPGQIPYASITTLIRPQQANVETSSPEDPSCLRLMPRDHPHGGARDAHGCFGYIHDPTFLRNHPLPLTERPDNGTLHICELPLGEGPEGPGGAMAFEKIRLVPSSQKHPKVLCIVYTHSGRHHILQSIAETWGPRCDGFLATSNATDARLGAVDIVHRGPERYSNMWQKVRSTLAYVYDHYLNDYDWFHIGGDDMFVIPENLRYAMSRHPIDDTPLYLGFAMIRVPYSFQRYCGGGAGYSLNRAALKVLLEEQFYINKCGVDLERLGQEASDEDRIVSDCLRPVVNCTHAVDEENESQYHVIHPHFHALWNRKEPANWIYESLELKHNITATGKEFLEGISESTATFHLVHRSKIKRPKRLRPPESPWLDQGMRRMHAIVHALCQNWVAHPQTRRKEPGTFATAVTEDFVKVVDIAKPENRPVIYHCGKFAGFPEYAAMMTLVFPEYTMIDIDVLITKRGDPNHFRPKNPQPFDIFLQHWDQKCSVYVYRWLWQFYSGKTIFVYPEAHNYSRPVERGDFVELGPLEMRKSNHIKITYMQVAFCKFHSRSRMTALFHNRPRNTGDHFLCYAQKNCVDFREDAFAELSKLGKVYYGGKCDGSAGTQTSEPVGTYFNNSVKRHNYQANINFFSAFKFCLVMEHAVSEGYVTEKILMAFWAGCVPIYFGTQDVFEYFNKDAFIFYNISNPRPALEHISALLRDDALYNKTLSEPILAKGEATIRKYFSFADYIADGELKQRIRSMIGLHRVRFLS